MDISAKKILVYRLGSLGDTVIALPCFNKIRSHFPNADITLLTNKPVMSKAAAAEVVLGDGYFYNRVINYPVGTRSIKILFDLFRQIRSLNADLIINIAATRTKKANTRDYWFYKLAGIKNFIGFPNTPSDFELAIDPVTGDFEWEADRLARRISALGAIPLNDNQYWDLHLTTNEHHSATEILGCNFIDSRIIAISAGTKMQSKDWEDNNWAQLMAQLKMRLPGWKLVILGSAEENERGNICAESWGSEAINLCGQTSPRVSAAILKKAKVFIGHDSGPMHLAACVGVPCVAIFSARNLPRQWFPRGDSNKIIYHKTDCAGCNLEICIQQQKKCILSITVNEVVQAVMNTIENI